MMCGEGEVMFSCRGKSLVSASVKQEQVINKALALEDKTGKNIAGESNISENIATPFSRTMHMSILIDFKSRLGEYSMPRDLMPDSTGLEISTPCGI